MGFHADGSRWQGWALCACVALPWLMLGANLLAWLRWGVDLPFLDDWRAYDERSALSLSPRRLFEAINNTISPVGLTLDVLAQRWLGGNSLAYQSLTMLGVLGGLLALQWCLLGWALRDRRLQAWAFAFCFPMLQAGSYWGEQNLAFHQALPLLALLSAAAVCLVPRSVRRWHAVVVWVLGLLAGLSYISGAVAALMLGVAWLLVSAWYTTCAQPCVLAHRARAGGWALLIAGALTSVLQIVITRSTTPGGREQFLGLTWPYQADFWLFLAGSFGRASGLSFASLGVEAAWVAVMGIGMLVLLGMAARPLGKGSSPRSARVRRWALVYGPLLSVVLAYLALVSAGRAGFREASIVDASAVFRLGAGRFHFFWVTLLFPWAAAGVALALRRWRVPVFLGWLWGGLLALCVVAGTRGVFDVVTVYRSASDHQLSQFRCIARQLGSDSPIVCPGLAMMGIRDLSRAYAYAREIDASFVRYLPILGRDRFGDSLLDEHGSDVLGTGAWRHVQRLADGWMRSEGDAQLVLSLSATERAADCRVLGVRLGLLADRPSSAQVFYRVAGQAGYSEEASVRVAYVPDAQARVVQELVIDSAVGFEPELRLDPFEGEGRFRLSELQVVCRLSARP